MISSGTPRDERRFADWVRPGIPAARRLAARLAGDDDADDVVQESLTRAWRKRSSYDPDRGSPTTWLLAIVADQSRSSRMSRLRRLRLVDDRVAVPDVADERPPADLALDDAIRHLSHRQQLAVHLHYFVGMTVDETAQVMACSPGTVKSTLYDARTRLRALLGDDDD